MPPSRPRTDAAAAPETALLDAAHAAEALLRERLAGAGAELIRPAVFGIDDEIRARAALLIDHALEAVERALRAAEPALDAAPPGSALDRFRAAGLLRRSSLGAAALLRAEEHRLAAALIGGRDGEGEAPAAYRLDPIGGDLAAESFAVRAAEAARLDRHGDPLLPLHDIAAEDRHAMFWQVAACLADAALDAQGEARGGNEEAMHRAAAGAVARSLAVIDDGDGVAAAATRLAHALARTAQLDDAMIAGTLGAGRVATLAAMLAVRAGIGFEEARMMLTAPERCAVLLRAAGVERPVAAAMIVALALALDRGFGPDPAEAAADIVARFEALAPERAVADVRRARLEPHYREALALLEGRG